jgi:TolB-like protein/class 3 adenylate cyclase/Tfp pilus assembly protein PilF
VNTEVRRLAAIMFTDMVDYSALTQRNEKLALELLEEHRALLRALFPRFNGVEIKTIGDAFLVEFQSALEATQCAIEIQRTLAKRNTDSPADRRIEVKIGLHIGDLVHREGDVLGDGVNIASRIEPLAGAGGICVSVDVERQIRSAIEVSLVKLAPTELKNIQVPIELFRIVLPWEKKTPVPVPVAHSTPGRPFKKALPVALSLLLVSLGTLGIWFFGFHERVARLETLQETNAAPAGARVVESKSVAVLPFVNMSSDKENEYLSDGITEDLCTALAQVRGLRVPARSSCFVFKGKTDDVRKIGQQLKVAAVLEGSVSQSGKKLRITAQLINIADGFHLWATNYDREMSDLLALRSEIAQQVVAALRVQLLHDERKQLEKKGTENPEAHRLYLLGRFFWNQRTVEDLTKAIDHFEQALAKDPNYALAHVGLADCYLVLPAYTGVPTKESIPKARAAALAALKLDKTLGEAHAALAAAREEGGDWRGAEAEFRQAIELSPNYATAHCWYSAFLQLFGRFDEANREIQRAQELDPLSPAINVSAGALQYYQGHYDEAIAVCRKALELNPHFLGAQMVLGDAYLMKQMYGEAIAQFQTIRTSVGNAPVGLGKLGRAYAISGQLAEADKVLKELTGFLQRGHKVQFDIALVYHGLGNREKALDWLEKAFAVETNWIPEMKVDPLWQDLRSEPRIRALFRKTGLDK